MSECDGCKMGNWTWVFKFSKIQFLLLSVCGGSLSEHEGLIALVPVPSPSADCEWTIDTVPGGRVSVSSLYLTLPVSEFCTDTFVEFRETNASGPLIGRYCGIAPRKVESDGTMWIRLRHRSPELEMEAEPGDEEEAEKGGGGGKAEMVPAGQQPPQQQKQHEQPTIRFIYTKSTVTL